jgi:hypothetical protein
MDRLYRTKSRDLYRLWMGHDPAYHGPKFGSYRPEFCEAPDVEGMEITGEVEPFLGEDHYVEFRPFRGIAIRDGGAVELEAPRFVTGLTR